MEHEWKVIKSDNATDKLLYKDFMPSFRNGYLEINEEKYCMPVDYLRIIDQVEKFEVRESDVIIASHPKTGNYIYTIL